MPKLRGPLLSLGATGGLTRLFSLARRRGQNILEKKPIPTDAKSPVQLFYRHMFSKCADLWHTLSEAERQEWESLARPRHMTGYAWFISQCLRPNPGIYLPLQGGTMSGDIDMDKNRLLKLPAPTDDQEAATKNYVDTAIPPGGYTQGARVYHSVAQELPASTFTYLAFDSETYDTDNIHDTVTNNSRLTCKTAGIYIITGLIRIYSNPIGHRLMAIYKNGTTYLAYTDRTADPTYAHYIQLFTIYHLEVNEYLQLRTFQNSGLPLDCFPFDGALPVFEMQRIG